MFPRLAADNRGNLRVVYHDSRRGDDLSGIYMSTFVSIEERWESSGQGGQDRLVSNGPADSLHPDIAIDETGGISVVWHDLRDSVADPDFHEEVYALYCPKQGHPGVHYPPLQPNIEARLDVDLQIKDSVTYQNITLTDVPEVSLAIKAPNATFWRAANEDGNYSDWQAFKPNFDLETMIVPWTLICTGGKKQICVQVQDAEMVAFPICREVTLTLQPPEFKIEFFEDDKMTVPLASFKDRPVTKKGNVYVKFSSKSPQILPPKFDVISAGQRLIFNQETDPLEDVTGSAGIGSYIGKVVTTSRKGDVSPAALSFSAAAGRTFGGRFEVKRHDGLLNVDGLARVIVRPRDLCGEVKSGTKQETAEQAPIGKSETKPNLRTDKPSNDLNKYTKPIKPPPKTIDPIIPDPGPFYFTIKTHLEPELPWTSTYKNIYKWRLFSEGGDGYPSLSWDGTNFYANPSIVGTYAVIHRFRIKTGYVLPQGGYVTSAKLLRMRIKVIALDNPSSLSVEVCKYNSPLEAFPNENISLGEPLETILVPGTSLPTWPLDAYNQYLPARHPNDNIEQAKNEFTSIPMLTVEFGGSTIINPPLPVEDPSTALGTILNPYSQDYCIVLRESGDINTDPSGRFVIYANGNGFGRNSQEFSAPLVSSYREQWSNRGSIYAVQGDVRLPWSYMELDFVSA
jgi:hypothetical protein